MRKKLTILVCGGGGYLGSVLVSLLLSQNYRVKVIDRFFFGKDALQSVAKNPDLTLIETDSRWYSPTLLKDVDTIMDLSSLSNDPVGELNPEITLEINYRARVRTATLAKKMGVKRYILASSCSVYGASRDLMTESSPLNPLTTYARASSLAEENVLPLGDKNFGVTVLRQGTLFGISPRMRFDILLNTIVLSIFKDNKVIVKGGEQWRPIVHVLDSAHAFMEVMKACREKVNREIFNVGSTDQNFQVLKLASYISSILPVKSKVISYSTAVDNRSYRASCEKIKKVLNYKTKISPREGAIEVFNKLSDGKITDHPRTRTIDWYKILLSKDPLILSRRDWSRYEKAKYC